MKKIGRRSVHWHPGPDRTDPSQILGQNKRLGPWSRPNVLKLYPGPDQTELGQTEQTLVTLDSILRLQEWVLSVSLHSKNCCAFDRKYEQTTK